MHLRYNNSLTGVNVLILSLLYLDVKLGAIYELAKRVPMLLKFERLLGLLIRADVGAFRRPRFGCGGRTSTSQRLQNPLTSSLVFRVKNCPSFKILTALGCAYSAH